MTQPYLKCTLTLATLLLLAGCDPVAESAARSTENVSAEELQQFIQQVKGNLIFVEGGEFLMGDYGPEHGPERLPYDADQDSKPLHKVELSSYSMGKFKVTNQEYQFYLRYSGLMIREVKAYQAEDWKDINTPPNNPAHMDWFEADKYCTWLAQVSELPFALPTEAQWEYAARSRGQFLMVATDDGTYKAPIGVRTEYDGPRGVNISTASDRRAFAREMGWKTNFSTPLPVDRFPPNPLGLHDMSDNGLEWVKDWYDPNYYQYSPLKDPQGPDKPMFKDYFGRDVKVMRGQSRANPFWGGVNVHRTAKEPHAYTFEDKLIVLIDKTARCVVNSPEPVK